MRDSVSGLTICPVPEVNGNLPAADASGLAASAAQPPGISAGKSASAKVVDGTNCHQDEIALYDRQIRLWGVQAQERSDMPSRDSWDATKSLSGYAQQTYCSSPSKHLEPR